MNIINEDDIDLETTSVEVARVRADGLGSRRAWLLSLLSLALYILLIGVLFGHAIDFHFSTVVIGHPGDAGGFVWFLRWWPQALLSGHDPFMTNDIWYPVGQDLVWSTSVPFLSFLSYPLTLFLTPIAQYNVVLILVLALDAWYGFRLLKRSSHRFVVAWTAGLLVPFSSYVVGQSLGHLDLVTVFPYLGLLFAIQDLVDAEGPWSTAWARLFIYSIISIYVSIELFVDLMVLMLVMGAIYAPRASMDGIIARLRHLFAPTALFSMALLIFGSIVFLFAVHLRYVSAQFNSPEYFVADLVNYFVPTVAQGGFGNVVSISAKFLGNDFENGAFIALPSFVALWFYLRKVEDGITKGLFMGLAVIAFVLSFGPFLTVLGNRWFPMPWYVFSGLPVIRDTLPVRLTFFIVPLITLAWGYVLQRRNTYLWSILLLFALVAQGPYFGGGSWRFSPDIPKLFTTNAYRTVFPKGSVLAFANSYIASGQSSIAQADTGFYFRMIGFEAASNEIAREPQLLLPPVVDEDIASEVATFRADLNRLGSQFYVVPTSSYFSHLTFYRNFKFKFIDGIYVAHSAVGSW